MSNGLAQLAESDLALGNQNNRLDAGSGSVGRSRSRSVTGRCANDSFGSVANRLRHRHSHSAVFERTGRVHALDL